MQIEAIGLSLHQINETLRKAFQLRGVAFQRYGTVFQAVPYLWSLTWAPRICILQAAHVGLGANPARWQMRNAFLRGRQEAFPAQETLRWHPTPVSNVLGTHHALAWWIPKTL